MSSQHHITRDVIVHAVPTDDPTVTPTFDVTPVLRPVLADIHGVLYVNALGSSGGVPTAVPISQLGTVQGATNDAAVGMDATLLWSGATDNNFNKRGAATADNMNPAPGVNLSNGTALATAPGEWSIPHTPAVGVKATITRAAVAGVRHICKAISASLAVAAADVAVDGVLVNLRDGVTGAGTILWSQRLCVVAVGGLVQVNLADLNIAGSANTAMTLEFAAAPGAASFETVTLGGISANPA